MKLTLNKLSLVLMILLGCSGVAHAQCPDLQGRYYCAQTESLAEPFFVDIRQGQVSESVFIFRITESERATFESVFADGIYQVDLRSDSRDSRARCLNGVLVVPVVDPQFNQILGGSEFFRDPVTGNLIYYQEDYRVRYSRYISCKPVPPPPQPPRSQEDEEALNDLVEILKDVKVPGYPELFLKM